MQWEALTAADFKKAALKTQTCVLPIGVIEQHGGHLPIGTDYLMAHKIACLAAEKEPAVVFPHFYFGQAYESRHFPGAVTIEPPILFGLIQSVLDEIGRNGFKKIIIFDCHGGNDYFLQFVSQCSLWKEKPYMMYYCFWNRILSDKQRKEWDSCLVTKTHKHACECETSVAMACFPDLIKMDKVWKKPTEALNRMKHIKSMFTALKWYSDFPLHYAGDARTASLKKGVKLRNLMVDALAERIAAIKKDKVMAKFSREFFDMVKNVGKNG